MSTLNDGGPAFPCPPVNFKDAVGTPKLYTGATGMTLRDYFAGQALIGAVTTTTGLGHVSKEERAPTLLLMSQVSYEIADAMLKAKEAAK